MESKILLVDDEKDIIDLLEEILQKEGFHSVRKAYTGLEVCKQIREFSYCSILFLSSKNDDVNKSPGLSYGGDDYIIKPFSPREVVFRIKAQLRRQQYQTAHSVSDTARLTVWPISIDKESCLAYKAGQEIRLTDREFLLLSYQKLRRRLSRQG